MPDDLGVCVGHTLATDRVIRQLKALDAPRVQIVVAVVALDDVAEFYVHSVHLL
ncbi:MAG: hypothetical protein ACXV5G_11835 [Halobacteriota archaeon]